MTRVNPRSFDLGQGVQDFLNLPGDKSDTGTDLLQDGDYRRLGLVHQGEQQMLHIDSLLAQSAGYGLRLCNRLLRLDGKPVRSHLFLLIDSSKI